jgi:uncharacterized membrane protein
MTQQLTQAAQRVAEWEKHHVSALPKPSLPRSTEDRMADAITAFAGSVKFVYVHTIWFGLWILVNAGILLAVGLGIAPFDPYPFGLLTMVVSLEAIFLSTFVLIAQNRLSELADARAQADYECNLLTEREVAKLLHLVQALVEHHILTAQDVQEVLTSDGPPPGGPSGEGAGGTNPSTRSQPG